MRGKWFEIDVEEIIQMSLDPTELIEGEDTEGQSGVESEGGDTSGSGTVESSPTDATATPGTSDNTSGK